LDTFHSDLMGSRTARRRSRWGVVWRALLTIVLVALVSVVVYAASVVGVAVQEMSEPLPAEVPPEVRPVPVQAGHRINILALGLDDERLRSDTMMLISVDPEKHKVGVLQIPRDTRAVLAGRGTLEKINGAYAYGVGDKQFPANLRALKTVETLLEVPIHYTAVVDLDGFRKAIDSIGGVVVDIPQKMDYDDPEQGLSIHFEPGRQNLNGKQALEFVRWRKNNDGTGYPDGDLGRIRTQQQFMAAVMDQLLKPANINLLTGLAKYVSTTMESSRILSLATQMVTLRRDAVEFATLPGTDAYMLDPQENRRLSYYVMDPQATRKLVDRLVRGIDPQAAAAVRVQIATTSPSDSSAAQLADRLTSQGFQVSTITLVDTPPAKTRIVDLKGNEDRSQLVGRSLVSMGHTVELVTVIDNQASADVRVILGRSSPGR